MSKIKFNINNYVYVKITPIGLKELKRQHDDLYSQVPILQNTKFNPPKEDNEGWSKWQMHDLIGKLGYMTKMGFEVPFEIEIMFEVKDNDDD